MSSARSISLSITLLALAASFAPSASIVQGDAPGYCEIALDFSVDGRAVASPSAIVAFGQQADVTIGDDMHGWHFSIGAGEPRTIRRVNSIPVEIDVYEVLRGEQILRASPHFAVAPSQRADLDTIFADDGRKAHIGLVARLKSAADVQAMKQASGDSGG